MTLNAQNVYRWLTHIPPVACRSLSQRCQWLSPVTQTTLTKVHFKTRELVLASVAASIKIPALPPNLISQWIEVGWDGDHSSLAMKSRQSDLLKLATWNGKTISTPRKINVILLNNKINRPELVSVCGYTLATNWQNFAKIYLA